MAFLTRILLAALATTIVTIHANDFAAHRTISTDVAILGGGAAGTYAAVRLKEDLNTSVVVIEAKDRLGGHAHTFVDPTSKTPINYGVHVYTRYGPAESFFSRLGIDISPAPTVVQNTINVDITTGRNLSSYQPPSMEENTAALKKWLVFAQRYESEMLPGYWRFFPPGKVPSELLLPFSEFAQKYGLQALAPLLAFINNVGVGGYDRILTWEIMGPAFGVPVTLGSLNGDYFVPKDAPNTVLYDRAYSLLRDNVMLNSRVVQAERDPSSVRLLVQSSDGNEVVVKAKRLLVTAEPSLSNLASLGLDQQETSFFQTFTPARLFTTIIRATAIPYNYTVNFISPEAIPNHYLAIRNYPYSIYYQSVGPQGSHLFQAVLTTNYTISHEEVKSMIVENVQKLVSAGTFGAARQYSMFTNSYAASPADVEILAFSDHSSVVWKQPAELVQAGLVQQAYALQGHRSTWWAGSLWCSDYSSNNWAFVDTVLPRMLKGMAM